MRLGANAGLLHQMQAAEKAGCSWLSEGCAAQMEPFRAECSAFRLSEMRLSADAGLLHQMRAAENAGCCMAERALLRKRSPSGRSAALAG